MTTDRFHISIRPPRALHTEQETAVLREALRHRPGAPLLRSRLARALLAQDAFGALIELLDSACALGSNEVSMLIQAHLACETRAGNVRTIEITEGPFCAHGRDEDRAQWLADRAKAWRRLGRIDLARVALERALKLDPANGDACKRLAAIDLASGPSNDTIAVFDGLAERGVSHTRLFAARALVRAKGGQIDAAREIMGFETLHFAETLEVPVGATSLAAFNQALATELLGDPRLRSERYGAASRGSWRIDALENRRSPMVSLLLEQIARAAERHATQVASLDHDWVRGRPESGELNSWCVAADPGGHETWHLHESGWLSGVYYVQIPPSVTMGTGKSGCIGFGLPEALAGDDATSRYGLHMMRPTEGMLLMFPSHSYHRTFPHGSPDRRICVAFDILPARSA